MKLNAKNVLQPAAILCAICLVVAAALAGTNLLTADRIAQQAVATAERTRKVVLPEADSFESAEGYYTGSASGALVGYVFETEAKGYGGTIKVMTGISAAGEITGVAILSHSETPGLGANAERESYTGQYKQAAPDGGLALIKNRDAAAGEIEALTGATITSRAVTNAVNEAVAQYQSLKGGA